MILRAELQRPGPERAGPFVQGGRKGRSPSHRDLLSGLETSWNCPAQLQICFRQVNPYIPSIFVLSECEYLLYVCPTVVFWQ